ncbi:hypothetical protein Ga0466249_005310 [Sporomusaceae bacterium BoRhaA]|uniref:hypothetical protein n=1 Tax=Pelorhabdus rhamnosifermentans TaxID=2772457 RepID=UPI001C0600A0|nr:hypothetical protein [Pelorhabdus rhamnosifermentans]MBU2704156.1 hypothetical protein [Pelorhabdus rhamnosifermentans]
MTQGLQCFDANGNLVIDVTDHLTKTLGSFTTPVGSGSNPYLMSGTVVDDGFLLGTPWYVSVGGFNFTSVLAISVTGNKLSWSYNYSPLDGNTIFKVIYGVF